MLEGSGLGISGKKESLQLCTFFPFRKRKMRTWKFGSLLDVRDLKNTFLVLTSCSQNATIQ